MEKSDIQWTDATWNVARGCTKVNDDCKFCYMMREGDRRKYDGKEVVKTKTVFDFPLKYKETKSLVWGGRPLIFTSSLTDFFHPDIDAFRHEAWAMIRKRKDLIFQILTKRPERIKAVLPDDWEDGYDNVWLGTSCGTEANAETKIPYLLDVPAKVRFISIEPLTAPLNIGAWMYPKEFLGMKTESYDGLEHSILQNSIHWVIVGGESGNDNGKWRYRPCHLDWISDIVNQCKQAAVPVFVKQLGTHIGKEMGLSRHAGNMEEWPEHLKIRQFPPIN